MWLPHDLHCNADRNLLAFQGLVELAEIPIFKDVFFLGNHLDVQYRNSYLLSKPWDLPPHMLFWITSTTNINQTNKI